MLGAAIIVFREIIEAGLIVGIVLACTRDVAGRTGYILGGVAGGLAGALLVALGAEAISTALAGMGQEIFNAIILSIAVVMLAWHNVWMARHGRVLAMEMKSVGDAVASGARSLTALAVVVGVAVLREGSEVALFLYGVAVQDGGTGLQLLAGGLAGLALGGGLSYLTYRGLVSIPARHLFSVTSALIALLAAGMAAQAVDFLERAGVLTALGQTLWDTSALLSDKSLFGRALHTLIGYSDRPSVLQGLVYAATLIAIVALMRAFAPAAPPPKRRAGPLPAE